MSRWNGIVFLGFLAVLATPVAGWSVGPEPGRDQAVLDAIFRLEQRYLEEDRRDPNVGYSRVLAAEAKKALYGGDGASVLAARGRVATRSKHLDKLLSLRTLTTQTVIDGYAQAAKDAKAETGARALFREYDRARLEAYKDLMKELRLKSPATL